jgi:hypothetical protein
LTLQVTADALGDGAALQARPLIRRSGLVGTLLPSRRHLLGVTKQVCDRRPHQRLYGGAWQRAGVARHVGRAVRASILTIVVNALLLRALLQGVAARSTYQQAP